MEFGTHVTSKIAKNWQHIRYKGFIVVGFLLPRKFAITATNESYAVLFLSFIFLANSWSRTSARICGPLETPTLIFSKDIPGSSENMCWKHSPSVFNALTNCFIKPSLIWSGGNMIFSQMTTGSLTIFGIPAFRVSRMGHSFWFQCFSQARLPHMQR